MWLINQQPRPTAKSGSGLKHEILMNNKTHKDDRKLPSRFGEAQDPRKKGGV